MRYCLRLVCIALSLLIANFFVLGSSTASANIVGETFGQFSVGTSGAAEYSIPILLPPIVGNAKSSLALNYSSGSARGIAGYGWNLSGLASISRCPTSRERDGLVDPVDFDGNDKFCINGQRLVDLGSNNFRKEIDDFSKIEKVSNGFVVTSSDGITLSFGSTPNSRILAQGRSDVMTWALSEARDSNGNYYTVKYDNYGYSSGEYLAREIVFSNSAGSKVASVEFDYEERSDVSVGYIGGTKSVQSHWLTSVETFSGVDQLVKSYQLDYEYDLNHGYSILTQVTECGSRSEDCYRPVNFEYRSAAVSFDTPIRSAFNGKFGDAWRIFSGDFDGDGRTDTALVHQSREYGWIVKASPSSGDGSFEGPVTTSLGGKYGTDFQRGVGDFNGDGLTDVSMIHKSQTYGWIVKVALSNGDGSFSSSKSTSLGGKYGSDYKRGFGDFNGDGLTDVSMIHKSREYGWIAKIALSKGNGTFYSPVTTKLGGNYGTDYKRGSGDFNGDGLTDISMIHKSSEHGWIAKVSLAKQDGTFSNPITTDFGGGYGSGYQRSAGDFNGDGLTDISLIHKTREYGWIIKVALARGDGSFEMPQTSTLAGNYGEGYERGVGDFNGDGLMDLSLIHRSKEFGWIAKIALGNGDGSFTKSYYKDFGGSYGDAFLRSEGDFNGDGVTDLSIIHISREYGWIIRAALSSAEAIKLAEARHSENNKINIAYGFMTDDNIYQRSAGASYPLREVQQPKALVREAARSNGIGGSTITAYRYQGLRYDLEAQRNLGFRSQIQENLNNGVVITSTFNQKFPYVGMKVREQVSKNSGLLMSDVTVSGFSKTDTSYGQNIWFPHATTRQEVSYMRDSDLLLVGKNTNKTTSQFNLNGQITRSVVETWGDDGRGTSSVETNNQYQNSYSKRRQGEIYSATVTTTNSAGSTITRTSAFEYDWSTGQLIKEIIEPNNSDPSIRRVTKYGYDSFGNRVSTVTCNGDYVSSCSEQTPDSRLSTLEYDSKGLFAVKATNALGHTVATEYEPRFGKAIKVTDANGLTASTKIDSFGRNIETISPLGVSTYTTRSWCSSGCGIRVGGLSAYYKVTVSGAGKPKAVTFYDEQNRAIRKQSEGLNGETIWVDTEYDSLGRVKRTSEPYFQGDTVYWNTPSYDVLSRKISVTTPNQNGSYDYSSRIEYKGFSTTITDGLGRTLTEVKDAAGNVVKMVDKIGGVTHYTYDALGKMIQSIDPAGNVINLTYDQRGRKVRLDDPDMGVWTYEYDTFDALVAQTDAKGQRMEVAYDRLGRKVGRTDLAGTQDQQTSTWVYDTASGAGIGKLKRVDAPNGTGFSQISYDSMGRVARRVQMIAGKTFGSNMSYNSLGQLVQVSYPETAAYPKGFAVNRSYNSRGYLKSVSSADGSKTFWSADAMSARGQLEAVTLGNGLVNLKAHSQANGWLIAQQTFGTGSMLRDATYHFDIVGNIKQRRDEVQGLSEMFEYDDLDRLTEAYIVGGAGGVGYPAMAYVYDAIGNIMNKSDVGAYSYFGCGGRPHAVCSAGGTDYTYDANGSMLAARSGSSDTQVRYTAFNKANFMQKGGHAVTFEYNGDRRRHFKSQLYGGSLRLKTYYVGTTGKGGKLFEREVSSSSGTKDIHYIYGAGGQAVATFITKGAKKETNYLHRDHLGSVVLVTDDLGKAVNDPISYDAWGKRRNTDWSDASSTANLEQIVGNVGFTGQESVPEMGLTHMNGRIYDSTLGRFLGADPLIQAPYNSQSFNRYTYVMNNPLGYIDPTGYSWLSKTWKKVRRGAKKVVKAAVRTFVLGGNIAPFAYSRPVRTYIANHKWAQQATSLGAGFLDSFGCAGACSGASSFYLSDIQGASLKEALEAGGRAGAAAYIMHVVGGGNRGGNAYGGNWAETALIAGGAQGISNEITGGSFSNGFKVGFGISALRSAALGMREKMVEQSMLDPENSRGSSVGFEGDGFKLGGGRYNPGLEAQVASPLGGLQGDQGQLGVPFTELAVDYSRGSFADYLVEAYAGPHDWLNSGFWYDAATGNIRQGISTAGIVFGEAMNLANVVVATPFVAGSVVRQGMYTAYETDRQMLR